ncbi:MAG: VTT domain-containing protein [Alphaproteobacteria bacterium]
MGLAGLSGGRHSRCHHGLHDPARRVGRRNSRRRGRGGRCAPSRGVQGFALRAGRCARRFHRPRHDGLSAVSPHRRYGGDLRALARVPLFLARDDGELDPRLLYRALVGGHDAAPLCRPALEARDERVARRRGVFASFIVRLVPSGPAVVVNMVAGVGHMRLWKFLAGTGAGIVPKTAAIAFFGGSLLAALRSRNVLEIGGVGAVLLVWVLAGIWVRRRWFNRKDKNGDGDRKSDENSNGPT